MLSLNPTDMIIMVINLLVLYFFLKKFLFKPVTAMIEGRQKEIEHNLTAAADQRIKAESMVEEYGERISNARHEAGTILSQAKQRAENEAQVILKSAQAKAKRLADEAESQMEADRQTMLAGVRQEVAGLALMAAAHVCAHGRNHLEDEALLDAFLSEVGEHP